MNRLAVSRARSNFSGRFRGSAPFPRSLSACYRDALPVGRVRCTLRLRAQRSVGDDFGHRHGDGQGHRNAQVRSRRPRGIAVSPDGTATSSSAIRRRMRLSSWDTEKVGGDASHTGRRFAGGHLPLARRQVALGGDRGKRPGRDRRHFELAVARKFKMKGKNPEHAVWSPDGKWLYVSAEEADSVDIVDLAKGEVVQSVKVGDRPRGSASCPTAVAPTLPRKRRHAQCDRHGDAGR